MCFYDRSEKPQCARKQFALLLTVCQVFFSFHFQHLIQWGFLYLLFLVSLKLLMAICKCQKIWTSRRITEITENGPFWFHVIRLISPLSTDTNKELRVLLLGDEVLFLWILSGLCRLMQSHVLKIIYLYVFMYVQSIFSIKTLSNHKNFKDIFRKHMQDKTRSSWLSIQMYSQFHISLKLVFIMYFSIAFIDTDLGFIDSSTQIEGTYYHITTFYTITNQKWSTLLFF